MSSLCCCLPVQFSCRRTYFKQGPLTNISFQFLSSAYLFPGPGKKSVEQMTAELTQFVAAVASGPLDRVRRARLLGRIERILKESLGSDAEILGYGSCFTDTAETDADIDATIYVPMTLKRAQAAAKVTKSRSEMLREVALKCRQLGMEVEENISHGTVTIGEAVSVHVASNTFRSYSTCRCVLSCQRLLPLFSSHLIREELSPRTRQCDQRHSQA